ncbi:MaoC/PaaZ C-terminal domain-containing protein [Neobacillus sp. 3P2-tot-E-2]|uniref:MaoC/PaaZ C-terminal domain-containing protein n=1 Tax=Neobacillus sp. 3P2-tot-E-2 TaxID=3132212 RepID=UPI00399F3855
MSNKQYKVKHIQPIDLVQYAGASGDLNPVHTIPDAARKSGHPQPIAHGMYVMGLVSKALEEWYPERKLLTFQVRFLSPTYSGEELIVTETMVTKTESDDLHGSIEFTNTHQQIKLKGTFELRGRGSLCTKRLEKSKMKEF